MRLTWRQTSQTPGRLARMRARVRGGALDEALLEGADPGSSGALRARAVFLTSRPHRDALAAGIEGMLGSLDGHASPSRVIPRPAVLQDNESALRSIVATLRGPVPVHAAGVALVHALVTDGRGPAHAGDAAALAAALEDARTALAGSARPAAAPISRPHAARVRGGTPATRLSETLAMSNNPAGYRRHEAA